MGKQGNENDKDSTEEKQEGEREKKEQNRRIEQKRAANFFTQLIGSWITLVKRKNVEVVFEKGGNTLLVFANGEVVSSEYTVDVADEDEAVVLTMDGFAEHGLPAEPVADRSAINDTGTSVETPDPTSSDTNLFAIIGVCLGVVCSFASYWSIVPIATLVTSGVGLSRAEK